MMRLPLFLKMQAAQALCIFSLCYLFCFPTFLSAQNRVEKPFQIQANFPGVFIKAFGQILSNEEVEEFDADRWIIPGIDIGYHFNRWLFLGYSFHASRPHLLREPWGLANGYRDTNIAVNYDSGQYHNLNLRFFPFRFGAYLGTSLVYAPSASYRMDAIRIIDVVHIGDGTYATDMEAEWTFKSAVTLGLGFGFQQVFKKGLSLGFGVVVPVIASPYYENIQFRPRDPSIEIAANDLAAAQEKLRRETFFYPIQFNILVGYNFAISAKSKE